MKVNTCSRSFVCKVVTAQELWPGFEVTGRNTTQKSRDITTTLSASKSWWLYLIYVHYCSIRSTSFLRKGNKISHYKLYISTKRCYVSRITHYLREDIAKNVCKNGTFFPRSPMFSRTPRSPFPRSQKPSESMERPTK